MNLDNLDRRIDKMLAAIEPQQEPVKHKYTFAMHLFSEEEQAKLQVFLDLLESKYHIDDRGRYRLNYDLLSVTEWDQLDLWCSLENALMQGDSATADYCRRWLAVSLEELIAMFLAAPCPDDSYVTVQEAHVIYRLDKSYYANLKGNHLERGRMDRETIDQMRRWLTHVDRIYNSAIMPV